MSTLGDYIHLNYENYQKYGTTRNKKSSSNGIDIVQKQKNSFKNKIANKRIQSNYQQLESFYNDMLYNPKSQAHKNMEIILAKELSDIVAKWQIDLTNGLNATGSSVNLKSFKFGEKKGFHTGNIERLKEQVEQLLINLQQISKTNENLQQLKNLTEELLLQSKEIEKTGKMSDFVSFKNYNDLKDFTHKINEILEASTYMGRSEAMGTTLEHALVAADDNIEKYINGLSDNLVKDNVVGNLKDNIQFSGLDPYNLELQQTIYESKTNFKNDTLKITGKGTGVSSNSIYKMDVRLTYDGEEYRISAKNYSLDKFLNIHLVQGRPLLMILLGNLDITTINHILNIICSSGSPKSIQQIGYDVLKDIIGIDALVGNAQKQGYADTLVINNRSARQVKVIPMALIAQQLNNMIKITPNLEEKMSGINQRYGDQKNSWVESKHRIDKLLAEIHRIKLSVSLDSTKLNWKTS